MLDRVLLDHLEDHAGVGFAQHDGLGALQQRQDAEVGPGHMEQRHRHQHRHARRELRPLLGRGLEHGGVVALGQLHALGQPRGPRGVELDDVVVFSGRQLRVEGRIPADPVGESGPLRMAGLDLHQRLQGRQIAGDLLEHRREIGARHHQPAAGVLEHEGDLRRGQPPVDGGQAGAGLQAAQPEHEERV
ncbi:hypothetical protein LJR164_003496 [Phenylobacterium sp. LjRoot164]